MLGDGIYTLLEKDQNKAVIKLSDANHPLFQAHFPTNPIFPGYMHLDIIAEIFDLKITSVKRAKFLKIVTPQQILIYEKNNNKFKVYCENNEIANFVL